MTDTVPVHETLQHQILYCVRDTIDRMSLPFLGDMEVEVRKLEWDGIFAHAGISIIPIKEVEGSGTTEREQIGYGIMVVMNIGTSRGITENIDIITYWRRAIRGKFNKQRTCMREECDGVAEQGACPIICEIVHEAIEVPEQYKKNRDWGYLVLRFWFLETRTTPQGE